jgi:hypothetical protein
MEKRVVKQLRQDQGLKKKRSPKRSFGNREKSETTEREKVY